MKFRFLKSFIQFSLLILLHLTLCSKTEISVFDNIDSNSNFKLNLK